MAICEERYKQEQLEIVSATENGKTTISWFGVSDFCSPHIYLNPVFAKLIERIDTNSEVDIDVKSLQYLNSATMSVMIVLLRGLLSKQCKIKVLFDSTLHWQRVNFSCLERIATKQPNLSVVG